MSVNATLRAKAPLPLSSHAKPVDSFAQAAELENELKRTVKGEVRFDRGSRALYATDGSNYRQIPIGLVVPRDDDDVIATVAACRKFGAPVLPRGAGTSLAGQMLQRRRGARFHEVHEQDSGDRSRRAIRARPARRRSRHAAQPRGEASTDVRP